MDSYVGPVWVDPNVLPIMLSWLDLGMTWSFVQCAGNGGAMILLASGKIHPTKSRFALAMRILGMLLLYNVW